MRRAAALLSFSLAAVPLLAATRISSPEYDNYSPIVHDGRVAWRFYDGNDMEIAFFDGVSLRRLTDNDFDDRVPSLHGGQVAWLGYDGDTYQVFLYDGSGVRRLTEGFLDNSSPVVYDGRVVWSRWDPSVPGYQIMRHDGQIGQLSSGGTNFSPAIHSGGTAWINVTGGIWRLLFHDGTQVRELGSSPISLASPAVNGGRVAWSHRDSQTYQVFLYDGSQVRQLTSGTSVSHMSPAVSGERAAWFDIAGSAADLIYFDGASPRVAAENVYVLNRAPSMDGKSVAWEELGGAGAFVFDGSQSRRLSDPDMIVDSGVSISGGKAVWSAKSPGDEPYQIYMADTMSVGLAAQGEDPRIGNVNEPLPQPLAVRTTDQSGVPVGDFPVEFSISSAPVSTAPFAGASLSVSSGTTDALTGLLETTFKLGHVPGQYTVTAACPDCTPTQSTVTFTCCARLKNDNFKQSNPAWASAHYDNICHVSTDSLKVPLNCNNPIFQTVSKSSLTIADKGCALSSLATLINYHRASFDATISSTTPKDLNEKLKDLGKRGYTSRGDILWRAIEDPTITNGKIRSLESLNVDDADQSSLQRTREEILSVADEDLRVGLPVIFLIKKTAATKHFVLGVGKCGSDYLVADPGSLTVQKLDPRGGEMPLFGIRRFGRSTP
jgi:hypothetical protein